MDNCYWFKEHLPCYTWHEKSKFKHENTANVNLYILVFFISQNLNTEYLRLPLTKLIYISDCGCFNKTQMQGITHSNVLKQLFIFKMFFQWIALSWIFIIFILNFIKEWNLDKNLIIKIQIKYQDQCFRCLLYSTRNIIIRLLFFILNCYNWQVVINST